MLSAHLPVKRSRANLETSKPDSGPSEPSLRHLDTHVRLAMASRLHSPMVGQEGLALARHARSVQLTTPTHTHSWLTGYPRSSTFARRKRLRTLSRPSPLNTHSFAHLMHTQIFESIVRVQWRWGALSAHCRVSTFPRSFGIVRWANRHQVVAIQQASRAGQ